MSIDSFPATDEELTSGQDLDTGALDRAGQGHREANDFQEEPFDDQDDADEYDEDADDEDSAAWLNDESMAFVASLLTHMAILLGLALVPVLVESERQAVVLTSSPPDLQQEQIEIIDELTFSDIAETKVGAAADAQSEMAEASAEMFAEVAEVSQLVDIQMNEVATVNVREMLQQAVAPVDRLKQKRGQSGVGALGASGAIDRITWEILQSMEERPTLVVWLFDQSGSLIRQRQEIRDRFDRIYEELQLVKERDGRAFRSQDPREEPLLTSVIGFGKNVELLTEKPLADLNEIKSIVDNIAVDETGIENVFSAVYLAAKEYRSMRRHRVGLGPQRNVIFVVVSDERGDDFETGLEPTIDICRKNGIPVHVIGIPAPFGRETSLIKYIDPDPKYDQTPQWGVVDQGPESARPERVKLGFTGSFGEEPVLDSGFGPYALTRLSYETGGIYFTVHPNRDPGRRIKKEDVEAFSARLEYFFEPEVMAPYQPDYVSMAEYDRMVKQSPLRSALINAASMPGVEGLDRPRLRFVKRSDAALVGDLTTAQQDAAKLEPRLNMLYETLSRGEVARDQESNLRWQAGFDLALGRVLAFKVRTETYNAMLAKAKRGINFEDPKNNTWKLVPDEEISVGSKWEREANKATELLTKVVKQHPGTPWALLAEKELEVPIGWKWVEEYTDLDPPRRAGNNNNNNNNNPRDDERRMLERRPKRDLPKL